MAESLVAVAKLTSIDGVRRYAVLIDESFDLRYESQRQLILSNQWQKHTKSIIFFARSDTNGVAIGGMFSEAVLPYL